MKPAPPVTRIVLTTWPSVRARDAGPAPSPPDSRRSGPRPPETARNVFTFFKDSPVQFDPSALRTGAPRQEAAKELTRGARVRHEQFGDGVILRVEGKGEDAKLTVYFDRVGTKKFIARYAKLTRI